MLIFIHIFNILLQFIDLLDQIQNLKRDLSIDRSSFKVFIYIMKGTKLKKKKNIYALYACLYKYSFRTENEHLMSINIQI